MSGIPEVTVRRFLVESLIAAVVLSLVHAYALLSQDDTVIPLDFTQGGVESDFIVSWGSWRLSPEGLAAGADETGLSLGISKSRFEELTLELIPTPQGRGRVRVQLIRDVVVEEPPSALPARSGDVPFELGLGRFAEEIDATALVGPDGVVNLSRLWWQGGDGFLIVMPVEGATGPLVRSITLRKSVWPWSALLIPTLWLMTCTSLILINSVSSNAVSKVCDAVGLSLGAAAFMVPVDVLEWSQALALLAAVVAGCALVRRRKMQSAQVVLLLTLVFLATWLRFDVLTASRFKPLDPDAGQFRVIADAMTWFYDTQEREPLFILLVKLSQALFGDRDISVRLVSLAGSVLLVPCLWWAGREIKSPLAGFVAAALIAGNAHWASQSVRGLRLEWFTLALMVLTAAIFTQRKIAARRHAVWLGAAAAAVCLIRLTSLWFCLLGIAYAVWRRGWNTRAVVLALAIAVLPQVPFVIRSGFEFGDPLYAVNKHIKFYRNHEFQGQPGFPTPEEVARDAYTGPDVTSAEYCFGLHTPTELATRAVRGFTDIFMGGKLLELTCDGQHVLQWCVILSYVVVALSAQRMLLAWMLLLIGPIVWLYAPTSEPEWRLVFHVSAFAYLSVGLAAERVTGEE